MTIVLASFDTYMANPHLTGATVAGSIIVTFFFLAIYEVVAATLAKFIKASNTELQQSKTTNG